jgi:hypothetical protein
MTKLISFDDALKAAGGKDCSILLGNGFSSRYFSYRSLLDKADLTAEDPVRVLFDPSRLWILSVWSKHLREPPK